MRSPAAQCFPWWKKSKIKKRTWKEALLDEVREIRVRAGDRRGPHLAGRGDTGFTLAGIDFAERILHNEGKES